MRNQNINNHFFSEYMLDVFTIFTTILIEYSIIFSFSDALAML